MNNHVDEKFLIKANTLEEQKKAWKEKKDRYNKNKTSKTKLLEIISIYLKNLPKSVNKTKLVLCHGKKHTKKFANALLVDYEVDTNPDIVMDIWDKSMMDLFPAKSFDIIRMEHCSVVNINDLKWRNRPNKYRCNIFDYNQRLWINCKKLLKQNGYIENNYIVGIYYAHKYMKTNMDSKTWVRYDKLNAKEKGKIIKEVIGELNKLGYSNIVHKYKYNKDYMLIGL